MTNSELEFLMGESAFAHAHIQRTKMEKEPQEISGSSREKIDQLTKHNLLLNRAYKEVHSKLGNALNELRYAKVSINSLKEKVDELKNIIESKEIA